MAHDIDIAVGKRLKEIRRLRKISQTDLGKTIGITFQQIQKYEKGSTRVSASKLWLLAEALRVDISAFFHDVERPTLENLPELTVPLKLRFPHRLLGHFDMSENRRIVLIKRNLGATPDYGVYDADPRGECANGDCTASLAVAALAFTWRIGLTM